MSAKKKTTTTKKRTVTKQAGAAARVAMDPGMRVVKRSLIISNNDIIAQIRKAAGLGRATSGKPFSATVTFLPKADRRDDGNDMSVDIRC